MQCNKYVKQWDHSFSTYVKFSEKLTFLTPLYGQVYQGVLNVGFSENFA